MFAFLNNAHEANVGGLHARRAEKRSPRSSGKIARDRGPDPAPEPRLARADGSLGETASRTTSRAWVVVRPEVDDDSTGGQKYLPMDDGSFLAAGIRADQAHGRS